MKVNKNHNCARYVVISTHSTETHLTDITKIFQNQKYKYIARYDMNLNLKARAVLVLTSVIHMLKAFK
jgi:hypothetical protein